MNTLHLPARLPAQNASVLVIVLWISFGLVTLALYFAHTMSFELRAAENRIATLQAEQAINGAVRYLSNVLLTTTLPGALPDWMLDQPEAVPIGESQFWLIGRDQTQNLLDLPAFDIVDESAKLNLNTATVQMLQLLPWMTPELAAAIIDWRDSDSEVSPGGAEDEVYQRLNPPYRCKNAKFESVDELRLVYGMTTEILFGEDANLNGVLDPNENDADFSYPNDNRNGRLDPGLLEYVTAFSSQPNTRTNGAARINVSASNQQELISLIEEKLGSDVANLVSARLATATNPNSPPTGNSNPNSPPNSGPANNNPSQNRPGGPQNPTQTNSPAATASSIRSVLEFYIRSGLTQEQFTQIENDLTAATGDTVDGLVNVNTACEYVLASIPGIGADFAPALIAYRQSNRTTLTANPSVAWVVDILSQTNAVQAGLYLTGQTYQFAADIAAVGRHGRGYHRVKFIFNLSSGSPQVLYRQDLTHLGWALGKETRNQTLFAKANP